jgi:hypothetical protein
MNLHEIDQHVQDLTPHQLKILQVVYAAGNAWVTRANVARALGKRRLTPYDIDCLTMLSERALIEQSTRPTSAPGSDFAYIYHMTDDIAGLLQKWADLQDQQVQHRQRKSINLTKDQG